MAARSESVSSPLGEKRLDSAGSAVGAVRMDPVRAYADIPRLLQKHIDGADAAAWAEIRRRIDYIYTGIGKALGALENEAGFARPVRERVARGQKLFFKPNLVNPNGIDPATHGTGPVATMTPWPFMAALMRWLHDTLGITYHQMSLGEAGTTMSATAGGYSKMTGRSISTQAVMEGKAGDFYGGWGFYFVRKYLAESHAPGHTDDPMRGYEESLAGLCIAPGKSPDKLLVYDINKIADDRCDGREVAVPAGINYQSIMLHKAVIGGDPADAADRKDWPGCVLVNVPKLKLHIFELVTSAVKNLGIGLYPMEVNESPESGGTRWRYAVPDKPRPGMKSRLPHQRWMPAYDEATGQLLRGRDGRPQMRRTGGMPATMADVISAVKSQDILMLHVVEAIEATNGGQAGPTSIALPEGFVFASCDPVAVDSLCIRYLFKTVPAAEARKLQRGMNLATDFLQKVPLPRVEGGSIVAGEGYDSPIPRYPSFAHAEKRGVGRQQYHVVGEDVWQGGRLASVEGHLGAVKDGAFTELITRHFYTATGKPIHDLQLTTLAYAAANDKLTGSSYKADILAELDEDGDGVIDYDEKGKAAATGIDFGALAVRLQSLDMSPVELIKLRFLLQSTQLRFVEATWNAERIGLGKRVDVTTAVPLAMRLAQLPVETPDPLFPSMRFGKGKWPSIQYARALSLLARVYGAGFPTQFDVQMSPYGLAFRYAALLSGREEFRGLALPSANGDAIGKYHGWLAAGRPELPFVFYVPKGMGRTNSHAIPNVRETDDARLLFTAEFDGGKETWRELDAVAIP